MNQPNSLLASERRDMITTRCLSSPRRQVRPDDQPADQTSRFLKANIKLPKIATQSNQLIILNQPTCFIEAFKFGKHFNSKRMKMQISKRFKMMESIGGKYETFPIDFTDMTGQKISVSLQFRFTFSIFCVAAGKTY